MLLTIILTHIICLSWLLFRNRNLNRGLLLLALMMPVFGPLAVGTIRSAEKEAAAAPKERIAQPDTPDALTSSLNVRPLAASSMVPLEDALILDSPVQRRSLILNVLNDEPADYLDVLKEAQHNDDGEVVHYATTALAEQFSIADRSLQDAQKAYQENRLETSGLFSLPRVPQYHCIVLTSSVSTLPKCKCFVRDTLKPLSSVFAICE